jgi:5'-3' exonuclease
MLVDSPAQAEVSVLIDLSNLGYRALYANKDLKTSQGVPSGHVYGCIRMLITLFRNLNATICPVFCYDGKDAKSERLKLYPGYKGNRTPHEVDPISGSKELVINIPGLHIEQEGFEGDDAIAWAVNLISPRNIIIFTGDKDMLSLMKHPNVRVFSPNKGGFVEKADWLKEYHVEDPARIYLAKSLFGDASDNIKGVERLLKKQVEPILNSEKCIDVAAFYDMIAVQPESMSDKMWAKTMEAKDRVMTNYQVVLPRVDGFTKAAVKRTIKNQENKNKLLQVLTKYECVSTLSEAEDLYK